MSDFLAFDLDNQFEATDSEGRVRFAIIRNVHLDYSEDNFTYGFVDLEMLGRGGVQQRIHLSVNCMNKNSGSIQIPEVDSIVLCIFMPYDQAVMISTVARSYGLKDFIVDGILPQVQEGDHIIWSSDPTTRTKGAFGFIRTCSKLIKATLGRILDSTKTPVQINSKDIHAQLEHESGTKISIDEDGNVLINIPSSKQIFVNQDGSSADDDDALVTKKFLTDYYADLITKYNRHTHLETGATTNPPLVVDQASSVSGSMPDTVSTPDIRAKNT